MAARIRLFISIKSQSVQIRRCNIGRGGRSCLVFENPFVQFGDGVGSCVFQLNGQKLNFEPEIDCQSEFAYSLLWQIFGSGLLPQRWRKCGSTGHQASSGDRSRPWQKRGLFFWSSKMHNLKWLVVSDFGKQNDYLAMYPKISQSLYLAKEQVDKLTDSRLAMKIIIGGAMSTNLAGKSSKLGKPFRSLRNHLQWLLENMFLFSLRSRCFKLPEFLESNSKSSSARLRSQCCNTTCSKPLASTEASREIGTWGICMCFFGGKYFVIIWSKILSITNNLCFKL